jgi:hypothetical protein
MHTSYCIPHRGDLTAEEKLILRRLVEQTAERRAIFESQIDSLKVVARCGCGRCPGVLFSLDINAEPKLGPFETVASLRGRASDGVEVGAYLLVRDGQLSELEAIAWAGDEARQWPLLGDMHPIYDHLPSNSAVESDTRQGQPRAPHRGR